LDSVLAPPPLEQSFIKMHKTLVYKDVKLTSGLGCSLIFSHKNRCKRCFPTDLIIVFVQVKSMELDKNYDKTSV